MSESKTVTYSARVVAQLSVTGTWNADGDYVDVERVEILHGATGPSEFYESLDDVELAELDALFAPAEGGAE